MTSNETPRRRPPPTGLRLSEQLLAWYGQHAAVQRITPHALMVEVLTDYAAQFDPELADPERSPALDRSAWAVNEQLKELRYHWGGAYVFTHPEIGVWIAQRRDNGATLRATTAEGLHHCVVADSNAHPVPRVLPLERGERA